MVSISDVIQGIFTVIGIIATITVVLRILGKLFDEVHEFYVKVMVKLVYPLLMRLNKKYHKKQIESYFNELLFRKTRDVPIFCNFCNKVKVEWSDEDSVVLDLEENMLIVRVRYAEKLERVLAKLALLVSPYLVSEHLEPALGEEFSRLISIGVAETLLQGDPIVYKEFRRLVDETFGADPEYKEILSLIQAADDTSLYRHIVLFELRRVLERFGFRVNRSRLADEIKELLRLTANLDQVSRPTVCGYYVNVAIVRVGKLEKVALGLWERYLEFIRTVHRECDTLQRVYIVSAGRFATKAVEGLIKYITSEIPNLRLVREHRYRARYYKGRTNVPRLVVVLEFE